MFNADMLTDSFRRRGYRAELGFLYEKEPDFCRSVSDYFVVYPKEPSSAREWLEFSAACFKEIVRRRPRVTLAFQPMANIVGALATGWQGRFLTRQAWPADQQSRGTERIESILVRTPLVYANIACSKFISDAYPHRGDKYLVKTRVIYNAPTKLPRVHETPAECRSHFGIADRGMVLGGLGRLHEQKNFQLAIRAMVGLPEADLYIAGDGEQRAMLQRLAESIGVAHRVHFIGSIGGHDVTRFLKAIDLLLMPSLYEGHPLVMLEALSTGTLVLAHDIPVMREAGENAVLYADSDPESWTRVIKSLSPESISALRPIGIRLAARQTQEAMVNQYLEAMGLPHFKT